MLLEDTNTSRLTEESGHINSLQLCKVPLIDTDLICKVPPMTRQVLQLLPGGLHTGHFVWVLQGALSAESKRACRTGTDTVGLSSGLHVRHVNLHSVPRRYSVVAPA